MEFSLNGNDTITVAGRTLTRFFDKDYGICNFPEDQAEIKLGKQGTTAVINFKAAGLMAKLTLRLLVGSSDDAYINSIQRQWQIDPPSFTLINGQVVRRVGDGKGSVRNVVYSLLGGVPSKIPEAHSNADGDSEQAVVVWELPFALGQRQVM